MNLLKKNIPWYHRGLAFMIWASPFLELEFFFPIAVLFAYPKNRYLRPIAFTSLVIQIIVYAVFYPLEIYSLLSSEIQYQIANSINSQFASIFLFVLISSSILYLQQRKFIRKKKLKAKIQKLIYLLPVLFFPIALMGYYVYKNQVLLKYEAPQFLTNFVLYFYLSVFAEIYSLGGNRIHPALRRLWLSLELQKRKTFATLHVLHGGFTLATSLTDEANTVKLPEKKLFTRYAVIRETILPGWGHIFLEKFWIGFPLLFIYLLTLLFLGVFLSGYIDPVFGINFMGTLGLKYGNGDKKYFALVEHPWFLLPILVLIFIYAYSQYSIRAAFKEKNEKGLTTGFLNNLALSILLHFILLTVLFLIPATIRREEPQKKNEKKKPPQFYTIETEIPDNIEKINGGVISGIQEKLNKGEIIKDNKAKTDMGRIIGKTSAEKGKQVPPTYSNYISAKMRAPGFFTDYWEKAPYPYSCVIAYTITPEGEIINIQIVESSIYPEQDKLTVELIESMSPVLPYPNAKGDIRVTELFWNGTLDPDKMPTSLQKDMVQMFDGRYLEEEN